MQTRTLLSTTALMAALSALALLAGCGAEAARPPLDATWGLSVRMAVENQKLDPSLGSDRPVTGLDGVFAKNALDGYRKGAEYDPQVGKSKEPQYAVIPTVMAKEAK